ncbi:hypothetical protein [Methanobrevibacter sp.]|uniref:hypothetical protein n=1 Tax=Methanobrevibacter sp. TaxID=66852 RepID=UPI0026295CA4|nr:hypothetical protein [uncultured Methanobrevibacter sp.]
MVRRLPIQPRRTIRRHPRIHEQLKREKKQNIKKAKKKDCKKLYYTKKRGDVNSWREKIGKTEVLQKLKKTLWPEQPT